MTKDGLAETPSGTIPAPMYEKVEQGDNIARGHVEVTEIIAYDFERMEKERDEYGEFTGREKKIEKPRDPYFCQTKEQEKIFKQNNPDARIESFTIQLLESTAIEFINRPENIKQFTSKKPIEIKETLEMLEKLDWLHQAHRLGIPTDGRSKEDIEAEITFSQAASKEIPTTTSVS